VLKRKELQEGDLPCRMNLDLVMVDNNGKSLGIFCEERGGLARLSV
jgi:hypothetical protein